MARAKSSHRAVRIDLEGETQRIAIVSDTHGHPHPASFDLVANERPKAILHGGDIGDRECLARFGEIAPVIAVRGNIDALDPDFPDSIDIALCDGDAVRLRMFLIHQAVYGPKLRADVARRAHGADLVVCGHSHVPLLVRDRGMVVFNPGSIGPRRFHLPITFGVLDLAPQSTSLRHMSCETGERWLP
jgi:putative phosphoesterase